MTPRSTGAAVCDTVTNASSTKSAARIALSAARRWSLGKNTSKGSLMRRRNANSGNPRFRRKGIRECWRVLTRNRHVDVRQFFAQDSEGFGHPGQFVVGQEAHDEAWFRWMSDPACSVGCRFHLRQDQPGVIEKGSTRL